MKTKSLSTAALLGLLPFTFAHADDASSNTHMITAAWLHVDNSHAKSEPLSTYIVPSNSTLTDSATSTSLNNQDTLALTYTQAIDDHWSWQLVGGVPPKFTLSGKGPSALLGGGDLSSFGYLATVRQWSPTALALYSFGDKDQKLRPYAGVGISYTWFDNITLNPTFEQALKSSAGTFGGGAANINVSARASDSIDPVVTLGAEYKISGPWYAIGSISYLPLSTTATVITSRKDTGAAVTRSSASMDINPIVSFLGIGYRF